MQLKKIKYKNIWPLVWEKEILFNQEAVLVDAPIGTWKSFTYFDWVIYWLYKRSRRDILNVNSSEGYIEVEFETDHNFVVKRFITKPKKTVSCQTFVYKDWQEIVFKNESDQQKFLDTILPDRLVFTNTSFLMQDSENIFDMWATDRLNLLRDIFWLSNIEEFKDLMSEKKKECKAVSSVYKDTWILEETIRTMNEEVWEMMKDFFWKDKHSMDAKRDELKLKISTNQNIIKERNSLTETNEQLYQRVAGELDQIDKLNYSLDTIDLTKKQLLSDELNRYEQAIFNIDIKKIDDKLKSYEEIKSTNEKIDQEVSFLETIVAKENIWKKFICDRWLWDCDGTKEANQKFYEMQEKLEKEKLEAWEKIVKIIMWKNSLPEITQEKSDKENYYRLQRQISEIKEKLKEFDDEVIASIKEKIVQYTTAVSWFKEQIKDNEKKIDEIKVDDVSLYEIQLSEVDTDLRKYEVYTQKRLMLDSKKDDLKDSISKYNKAKNEEELYSILYEIFARELLMYVLSHSLPIIEDILNTLLAKVVSYRISFNMEESKTGKTSLEIMIRDERWDRDVSSLSWWQRVVLRIAWMLAINSYMNSQLLFMDETINNLDSSAIEGVWEMLEWFVKKNKLNFICVTHDHTIKWLNIWDKVVNV